MKVRNFIAIFACLLMYWPLAGCLHQSGKLSGQIFIVTSGGDSTKLGAVTIKAISEERFDAWLEPFRVAADPRVGNLPEPIATSISDADGHFEFDLPAGRYLITARASRELIGQSEEFYWAVWASTSNRKTTEIMLSNHNMIRGLPPDRLNLSELSSKKDAQSK